MPQKSPPRFWTVESLNESSYRGASRVGHPITPTPLIFPHPTSRRDYPTSNDTVLCLASVSDIFNTIPLTATEQMATIAIENPLPVNSGESNSTRKKKAKAGDGTPTTLTATEQPAPESPNHDGDANGVYEHPHLKELQKQIRGVNKKLGSMQKTDAVIAENPGVSLDELVAQRKINNDQKASAEKKPGLQAQVQQLEEQVQVFRNVNAEYQAQMQKQKDDIAAQHRKELEKMKEDTRLDGVTSSASELRTKLLVFSQFLRAAAAKRNVDEDAGSDENMAFEGALLLVYGGDEKAVDTAVSLIEGSDEQVPSIDGQPLPVKCKCMLSSDLTCMCMAGCYCYVEGTAN